MRESDRSVRPTVRFDAARLVGRVRDWGRGLGFDAVGISGVDLSRAEPGLRAWLEAGFHGEMSYMARYGPARARPGELVPGTVSVISARMNYLASPVDEALGVLGDPASAYVSRYALGRDYHKVLRGRLQKLADRIAGEIGPFGYRVFTDSAPVLEVELATRAGLGWRGKHTLLLGRDAGSWFFLGEIFTDLPLPADEAVSEHCGSCTRCLEVCPTRAIVAPYRLDARRCISYLTIEHPGSIPDDLRPLMGNRVYGCDDCQLHCPWNKYAQVSEVGDFRVRNGLDSASLVDLFAWTEAEFDSRMQGSAIRRIGFERWSRNLAVALGNAPTAPDVVRALEARRDDVSAIVREHVEWALARHGQA
ncbi:MAG: tRNA epoxyqueuosine(34) reductase QueG [Betaproteobacteria bacterium]|nr:tRNA epoxyqueuosine(34) reductase QueG [Betaproteobacteria bacterium]